MLCYLIYLGLEKSRAPLVCADGDTCILVFTMPVWLCVFSTSLHFDWHIADMVCSFAQGLFS